MPPDRRERLGAERVGARRIGPEAEVEDLAGGVPRADRAVGADDRRDPDARLPFRSEAHRSASLTITGSRASPRRRVSSVAEEVEVLGPVGAGEAEGGGGEIGRRGARGRERLVAGA